MGNLISDLLDQLQIRHTPAYCAERMAGMPFKSIYGLTKLLAEFGVETEGISLADKTEIQSLPVPFLAQTTDGFVIVTDRTPSTVSYLTQGESHSMPRPDFLRAWTGMALMLYPRDTAAEPHYGAHRTLGIATRAMHAAMWIGLLGLASWLFATGGQWRHVSLLAISAFNLTGLWLTWMLVRKSLHLSGSSAADALCGVLQEGGCDDILATPAAKFFRLFGWSEVGFAYFSVSLLTLLIFPQFLPLLDLYNALCLPFTLWSIWYQRFRAHTWCTLCVCVQATLWALFFCYLGGGWIRAITWPLPAQFWVLAATYVTTLLTINRLMPYIHRPD
ncbi:MAG: hypothetical protein K2M97_00700, partial [Muribaculaceae bacterium]|nr:hypothetical protein [Muribaculaceae bacterium]